MFWHVLNGICNFFSHYTYVIMPILRANSSAASNQTLIRNGFIWIKKYITSTYVSKCLNYLNIQEVIFFNCMSISMVASFIQNQTLNWNEGTDWLFNEKSVFLKISPICTFNMWLCNVNLAFTLFDRMFQSNYVVFLSIPSDSKMFVYNKYHTF